MFSDLQFNIFSLSLITSGGFGFLLSGWIMAKRRMILNWFSIMLLAASWWAVAYGFELSSTKLEQMLMWIKVEYLGIATLPSLWLIFAYSFIDRDHRLNRLLFVSLFIYSALTYLMMLTNEGHQLFYQAVAVDRSGPFPLLDITPGPWYHLHTAVFYGLVVAGYWALIAHFRHAKPVFKKQNRLLILSTLVPLLVNFAYIFLDVRPFGHLDLTPYAFLLTTFIIAIGLMRFGLFDVTPMARNKVIQDLPDGFLVLDVLGRTIDYNPALEELVNLDQDLFGLSIHELFPKSDFEPSIPEFGEEGLKDFIIERNDGQVLEIRASALFEKSGIFNGSSVLIKDVSKQVENRRSLEEKTEELSKLNTLKDRIFSVIAHDLRGPLLNLQEVLNLVSSGVISEKERDEILKVLNDSVGQNVHLMQNLLDWAISQQKGERLELQLFKLGDLIEEAIQPLKPFYQKKEQTIEMEVLAETKVYADRDRISIVVRNLISNAIKFTPFQGKIRIWCEPDGEQIRCNIRDNGVGMTEKQLLKLSQEQELESTNGTSQEKGTGLGLMLCRDFLHQHGSELQVSSELGFGSTFSFTLPALGT
jgi:signal transduction histidine kinase